MQKTFGITALGELLIDFTQRGVSDSGMALFERNPGGAVANVITAAQRQGVKTAFMGKVGRDMHGEFLKETLDAEGIYTGGLVFDDAAFTTLAFVTVDGNGERGFSFARKPGADTRLRPDEIRTEIFTDTRVLHVGSLSLTAEPSRSATLHAVCKAKAAGAIISYDPNYRAMLWPDEEEARIQMRSMLEYADIVKLSDSETELLTGEAKPEGALLSLEKMGIPCAAVTCGERGAYVRSAGETSLVPAFTVKAVDTTGAGDAFLGGFLAAMLEENGSPGSINAQQARRYTVRGAATAALCVGARGAIPAMPARDAVIRLVQTV